MTQVFVAGGSGFIGRALVRRLLDEHHSVRVLVRSDASARKVTALGAAPVRGELADPSTWRDALVGSEVLFHLAAETDLSADRARHELVTVSGTQAAVDAARHAKVPRFVLCGSEAGILVGEPLVDVDETAPLRPDSEAAYCAAKAGAERIVLDANAPGFATVSIRPRFVWGPESFLTAAREVPVPALWFLALPCILRTDKAVADLGYKPVMTQSAGLSAVRDWVAGRRGGLLALDGDDGDG
jgi:nucleoside-diphosphate-sugar epimerase